MWVCLVSAVQCWFWNTDKVSLLKLDPLSQFSCDICPACSHTFNKTELFFKMMSSTTVVHILFPSPIKAMQQKYCMCFPFNHFTTRPVVLTPSLGTTALQDLLSRQSSTSAADTPGTRRLINDHTIHCIMFPLHLMDVSKGENLHIHG